MFSQNHHNYFFSFLKCFLKKIFKKFLEKSKIQACCDRTDSVYPISVLTSLERLIKTKCSSPIYLLDEVCDKDSRSFLNGIEKHFTKLSQKILRKNFC